MNQFIYYVLIGVLCAVFYVILQMTYRKFLMRLSSELYEQHNPELFLKSLNSGMGKLFMSSKTRLFMSIDAYLLLKDEQKVESIIEELENSRMGLGKKIALFQKEITFYLEAKKPTQAIEANRKLREIAENIKDTKIVQVLEECDILIHVYARKSAEYVQLLLDKAAALNDILPKGIFYYRAAVCYYNIDDKVSCEKYLNEAKKSFSGSFLEKIMDQVLQSKNFTAIENKIM